ncbi:hypothetical protein DL762_005218 [Monosporascus cannonballus]|uniref:Uncharacterized protein n=1 Tax=Monosporascus cannonballus TaxID=155416 RepID=A0ABY0H5J0_9PEZI|nr:hypothetical protein DL762_005218 [Monosporascus cannonballus]
MLTDVHRINPRAGVLLGGTASGHVRRAVGVSSLQARHRQQTRAYRFGMWSSYVDPQFHKELRRRQRAVRHKLAEGMIRKLSWDRHPFARSPREVLKHIMERQSPSEAPSRSWFIDPERLFTFGDTPKRTDAEGRAPSSSDPFQWVAGSWRSQFDFVLSQWTKQAAKGARRADIDSGTSKSRAKAEAKPAFEEDPPIKGAPEDQDYVIDPITNRRISRGVYESIGTESESPTQTFKSHPSRSTPFAPDRRPPADELKRYDHMSFYENPVGTNISDQSGRTEAPTEAKTHNAQQPDVRSEEYSLNHLPPDEPRETYDDLHKYKPYMHNEPSGVVEDEASKSDDLHKSRSYYLHEKSNGVAAEPPQYDDLQEYGPYMHNEPNGMANEYSPKYDDLDKYGPYMHNEDATVDDGTPKYDDLDKYGPFYYREGVKAEKSSPKYDDLDKYDPTGFRDPVPAAEDRPFSQYGDLEQYQMFRYREPDGKPAPERDSVAECLNEFDAKSQMSDFEDSRPSIAERLQKLDLASAESQVKMDQPLKSSTSIPEKKAWDDMELAMDTHGDASDMVSQEVHAAIKESRARMEDQTNRSDNAPLTGNSERDSSLLRAHTRDLREAATWATPEATNEQRGCAEVRSAERTHSDVLAQPRTPLRLEAALDRQSKAATDSPPSHPTRDEADIDPYSKEPQGLETSYAKECERKAAEIAPYAKEPQGLETSYAEERDREAEIDRFSKEPQGLETSYAKECEAKPTSPTFAKTYEANADALPPKGTSEAPAAESKATASREPTVYKILAYDPTTQSISTAETTSVVPDQATPLTPAEALLRLSNPAKFLPHFGPLQAEGFEIASGGDDVLVFRRVRDAAEAAVPTSDAKKRQPPVNPIDMMGRSAIPNAAAFASPTGFVNYDLPSAAEEPIIAGSSTPPFRSGIDVRREEPVFSGQKPRARTWEAEEQAETKAKKKEKAGIGRRMVLGGVWVAGVSYALGVVSEYFVTGGADGKGPTGF